MKKHTRQLYLDSKKLLGLLAKANANTGFDSAIRSVFGSELRPKQQVEIGGRHFLYAGSAKNLVAFLPIQWRDELDKMGIVWKGCERWWAGYPMILLAEMRVSEDGISGYLRLNAEVGPASSHEVRKGMIEAIKTAAVASNLDRIQFQPAAAETGRLYSRFLRRNVIPLNDITNSGEIQAQLKMLVSDFDPELVLVATVLGRR